MALNIINTRPIQIDNEGLPYADRFIYPGSIMIEIEGLTWTSRADSI